MGRAGGRKPSTKMLRITGVILIITVEWRLAGDGYCWQAAANGAVGDGRRPLLGIWNRRQGQHTTTADSTAATVVQRSRGVGCKKRDTVIV